LLPSFDQDRLKNISHIFAFVQSVFSIHNNLLPFNDKESKISILRINKDFVKKYNDKCKGWIWLSGRPYQPVAHELNRKKKMKGLFLIF